MVAGVESTRRRFRRTFHRRAMRAAQKSVDLATFARIVDAASRRSIGAQALAQSPDALRARIVFEAEPFRDRAPRDSFAHPVEHRALVIAESGPQLTREPRSASDGPVATHRLRRWHAMRAGLIVGIMHSPDRCSLAARWLRSRHDVARFVRRYRLRTARMRYASRRRGRSVAIRENRSASSASSSVTHTGHSQSGMLCCLAKAPRIGRNRSSNAVHAPGSPRRMAATSSASVVDSDGCGRSVGRATGATRGRAR